MDLYNIHTHTVYRIHTRTINSAVEIEKNATQLQIKTGWKALPDTHNQTSKPMGLDLEGEILSF